MDCTNGNGLFQWQNGDSFLQNNSPLDISDLTWEGDTQDEDFSYIVEETTPIKACGGGSPYNFGYCGKRKDLDDEFQVTSSRVKRRRTLHFDDEDLDLSSLIDDPAFLKSKEHIDVIDEAFPETSQQVVGSQEASSFPGLECLDQVEDWLGDCFNYSETTHNPSTDMNSCGTTDVLLDITEFINPPTTVAPNIAPKQPIRSSRNIAFKGTQSYIQTQTKTAAFKVHPFSFIKPSELNGDMTLKAINRQIQIPPKPKAKDPAISAFSGKPVVNKTRIRTEGGQGSITIMRTMG